MLETLFKCASAPIITWDTDFTITRANLAFEKLTGLSSLQIIGNNLTQLFPFEQIEHSPDLISNTYSGTQWESVEIPITHVDGSIRSVLWNSAIIFEADGITPHATIAQGIDITERKLAEKELAKSELKLRTIFDYTSTAVMLLDEQGFFDCNKATLKMFGYATKEEFCALHPAFLSPPQQPCGTDSLTLANRHIATAMEKGVHHFEWVHRRGDNAQDFFADVLLSCVVLDDKKILDASVRDISKQKQTEKELMENEEKYRAMVVAIHGCMYICSNDYRIEFMNDQLIKRTGRNATGEFCYKALHDLDSVCEWCVNERVFKGEVVQWEIQSPKDGKWYEVNNSPIYKANGTISKQAIITDITERKQSENNLRLAKESAESANRAKSAFLSTMSHEIRTPMNAVMGNLSLLGTTQLTGVQQKCVQDCNRASQILLRVINDILDFSKIEAGKLELVKESYSPMRMLYSLVGMFTARADEKQLRLIAHISIELPHFILGARERLSQVIANLLSNAIKFTRQGSVTLSASTRTTEQGILQLVVSVSDSGIGIAPEQQSVIYDSFSQLDNSSTRNNVGTGLGLAISKRLVELMDGEITLSSTPAVGSTFTVTIPFILSGVPAKSGSKSTIRRTARKILLADDDLLGREVTTAMLERNGHKVMAVADGASVLNSLQQERFDILLSDISMPGMDGMQVSQIIRSGKLVGIDALIPIIALTAHAFTEDRKRFTDCGINGYIAKPVNFDELMGMIEETCGNA